MTDFDANEYLSQQASDIAKKHQAKPKKKLDQQGEEGTFVTKPYTVVRSDSGFEMKGTGAIDATLTGPRPRRPDGIIQDPKPKE